MITDFKNKSLLLLTVAGIILLAGLVAFFLTSARSDAAKPYDLGNPVKMAIYSDNVSVDITSEADRFAEILEVAESIILVGGLGDTVYLEFPTGGISEYFAANGSLTGLEIFYDAPVKLAFVENYVHRLFFDLDRALLFVSAANDGSYHFGAFTLEGYDGLQGLLTGYLQRDPITAEDLTVNGISYLGMSGSEAEDLLGEPISGANRVEEGSWQNEAFMVYWDTWVYQGFELDLPRASVGPGCRITAFISSAA